MGRAKARSQRALLTASSDPRAAGRKSEPGPAPREKRAGSLQDRFRALWRGKSSVAGSSDGSFDSGAATQARRVRGDGGSGVSELDGEGSEGYRVGGYHPVALGDVFNGRYTVVEKLGWGHFSTVWMVRDALSQALGTPRLVALKVQKSASHYTDAALDEIDLLRHARRVADDEAQAWAEGGTGPCGETDPAETSSRVVRLLDHFEHSGPNGRHVCMVFEMLGANLLSVIRKSEYRGLPIDSVRDVCRQICMGLDFLHRRCSIIHTDLKPENVLLKAPKFAPDGDGPPDAAAAPPAPAAATTEPAASLEERIDEIASTLQTSELSAEERKRLKKLKKQKQKQRKKEPAVAVEAGAHASTTAAPPVEEAFGRAGAAGSAPPCGAATTTAPGGGGDDELRSRVTFLAPWPRVYGGLGCDHRATPAKPASLDGGKWRCVLDGSTRFARRRRRRDDGRLTRACAAAVAGDGDAAFADDAAVSAFQLRASGAPGEAVRGRPVPSVGALKRLAAALVGVDLAFVAAELPAGDDGVVATPKPLASRLALAAARAAATTTRRARRGEDRGRRGRSDDFTFDDEDPRGLKSPGGWSPPASPLAAGAGAPPAAETEVRRRRRRPGGASVAAAAAVARRRRRAVVARGRRHPDDLVDLQHAEIAVVDLGNACWRHKHFTEDIQTRQYRSPEVIVGADYDTSADVWSLACIVFELLTGDLLFDPRAGGDYDRDEDHLAQMQELLGRYPKKLASSAKARAFFNRRGELKHIHHLRFWDLEHVLVQKYHHDKAEAREIAHFLGPMLDFYPDRRATAFDCLQHPWLNRPNGSKAPPVDSDDDEAKRSESKRDEPRDDDDDDDDDDLSLEDDDRDDDRDDDDDDATADPIEVDAAGEIIGSEEDKKPLMGSVDAVSGYASSVAPWR
ncbi:hypothetical protein JL721_9981 [Aureococcus anophagefferens]|nr:hypothetical protein JL721_9981 [Aureococcus anophagefferens]